MRAQMADDKGDEGELQGNSEFLPFQKTDNDDDVPDTVEVVALDAEPTVEEAQPTIAETLTATARAAYATCGPRRDAAAVARRHHVPAEEARAHRREGARRRRRGRGRDLARGLPERWARGQLAAGLAQGVAGAFTQGGLAGGAPTHDVEAAVALH